MNAKNHIEIQNIFQVKSGAKLYDFLHVFYRTKKSINSTYQNQLALEIYTQTKSDHKLILTNALQAVTGEQCRDNLSNSTSATEVNFLC